MNIVFFGTSRFSELVAEALIYSKHKILAIVTQPDKVNGRNNKVTFNELKIFASKHNIPCYQFEKLNRDGEEILKGLNADCFVTASYGQIIKQNILDICPIYNVHASLLPKYRGSAPIQWCLINGEKETGVSIMRTELGLDCGEVYLTKKIAIEETDIADTLFDKLALLGGQAIVEFLDNHDNLVKQGKQQDESQMTYFPMLNKEMSKLNFNNSSDQIVNLIRGLATNMTAYFIFNDLRYKVLFAKKYIGEFNQNSAIGEVLLSSSKQGLVVKTNDGAIEIITIQPEGKKAMSAKDFCNGGKIKQGDIIK